MDRRNDRIWPADRVPSAHPRASELHIALGQGFRADAVEIRLNGEEVFRSPSIETRDDLGLADSFEVLCSSPRANLWVSVPTKGLIRSFVLSATRPQTFLAISVDGDDIICQVATEPFGYR